MKIQINGFDIEINTEDETMAIKVIDASGKELSNNTYSQTLEGETTDITEPELNTPEEVAAETPETTEGETTEEVAEEDKTVEESVLSFEEFKKKL